MNVFNFYDDWMRHSNYWFQTNKEFDKYMIDKYGYLLDEKFIYNNHEYKWVIIEILIYDQLSRHIYRNENAKHIISFYNRKALDICLRYKDDRDFIDRLTDEEWIFYLLVYRHTNKRDYLLYVMDECWKRPINLLIKRFIKATYERAIYEEEVEIYDPIFEIIDDYTYDNLILDERCRGNKLDDVINDKIIGEYGYIDKYDKDEPIIISLSGGIDSITCLYMINEYYKDRKIVGCHINYNNRQETDEEVKFLRHICNHLGIRLYIRKIGEINRLKCKENDLRDVYESYTKRIRFNTYKRVYDIEMGGNGNKHPMVIMGHNKDDCFENILTNIAYMNKYDNLGGINGMSIIDDICIYRPLLNIKKEEIYRNGDKCKYLYLRNSTPEWSQRGKIRDKVLPIMERWDKRVIEGLFEVSEVLRDLHINLKMSVDKFKEEVSNMEIDDLNMSELYWKYGIHKVFGRHPSNKSIKAMIERLKIFKKKYDKTDVNKKIKIIISRDIYICIWRCRDNKIGYYLDGIKGQ